MQDQFVATGGRRECHDTDNGVVGHTEAGVLFDAIHIHVATLTDPSYYHDEDRR